MSIAEHAVCDGTTAGGSAGNAAESLVGVDTLVVVTGRYAVESLATIERRYGGLRTAFVAELLEHVGDLAERDNFFLFDH